ncbi:MAG: Glucose-1-phosphate adenylyltransferase (EC [uncultured Caballeronia sp.]|nr:MAG: Glucose-1-phosphate adenylyltransferase (EC [uncultured Caballeronia sp.]
MFSSAVRVHSFCHINEAVLLPQVTVGPSCRLKCVVIDRGLLEPHGIMVYVVRADAF